MKKTYNINLSGRQFIIDEDAYLLLDNYLRTLREAFTRLYGEDSLADDIEVRISELFDEHLAQGFEIVSIDMTREVIDRIGAPSEIVDDEREERGERGERGEREERAEAVPPYMNASVNPGAVPPPFVEPVPTRRLYRDPKEKIFGGVCSGIAHYFGMDPVWVRIIFVVIGICSASALTILYIILWVIIPAAQTPLQRLQMYGKSPTIDNIGRAVNNFFNDWKNVGRSQPVSKEDIYYQPSEQSTGVKILRAVASVLMVILSIAAIPVFLVCVVMIAAMITHFSTFPDYFAMWAANAGWIDDVAISVSAGAFSMLAAIGILLIVTFTCLALIICTLNVITSTKNMNVTVRNTLIIGWIAGLLLTIIGAIGSVL